MTQKAQHFYEFGPFRLGSESGVLMKDGEFVSLKPKAIGILLVLIENRGQPVTKQTLMNRLWPNTFVGESNLSTYINLLRDELGADWIKTISKRGYCFVGEVSEVFVEPSHATVVMPRVEELNSPATPQEHAPAPYSPTTKPPVKNGPPARRSPTRRIWIATVAVFVIVAIPALWGFLRRHPSSVPKFYVHPIPAETNNYYDAYGGRVSPDGDRVAFLARAPSSGKRFIFVQELDNDKEADAIEDSAGDSTTFFWSHDGKSLYFVTGGFLKRSQIGRKGIEKIAKVGGAPRGTVNQNGVVLLSSKTQGILRVLSDGRLASITTMSKEESAHAAPYFLPDGVTFLFLAMSHGPDDGVLKTLCSGRIDAPHQVRRIGPISSRVEFNAKHLLYTRDSALYARPWNLEKQEFAGPEVLVTERVWSKASTSDADFSVARNGRLIVKDAAPRSRFERVRPDTTSIPIPWPGQVVGITIARDRELAVLASYPKPDRPTDLWVWDLKAGRNKLTSSGTNTSPVLNATGEEVYYTANRTNFGSIYRMSIATREVTLVLEDDDVKNPRGLSSDGEWLLYGSYRPEDSDLHCINLKDGRVIPIADSPNAAEGETGRFSPDGTQVLFVSDVSGNRLVYVTAFPPDGKPPRPISMPGGWRARWSYDGSKIYYLRRRSLREFDLVTNVERELYQADSESGSDIVHMEPAPRGEFLVVIAPNEPPNRIVSNWQDAAERLARRSRMRD